MGDSLIAGTFGVRSHYFLIFFSNTGNDVNTVTTTILKGKKKYY